MIKLSFAKRGLRLFKLLRSLVLEKIYKAMFIQGATFIPDSRVGTYLVKLSFVLRKCLCKI